MVTAALVIFALTYLAVAGGRLRWLSLDRPAAALLGAVLMVAAGVLTPAEAGAAVNGDTVGLLLGMMVLTAYLGEAGFFRWASWKVITSVGTPRALLWGLTLSAGALSADFVGVDLLPTEDGGWAVLEVNGAVDFTSDYALRVGGDVFDDVARALGRVIAASERAA